MADQTHLMIDLETLSTRPSAALLEVGWAVFNPYGDGVLKSGSVAVDVGSQPYARVDAGTVDFWFKQPDASRLAMAKAKKFGIKEAIEALDKELSPWGQFTGVWSHGPAFDVTILQFHLDRLGRPMPWSYKAVRDTRTLAEACKLVLGHSPEYPQVADGANHTGEADAVNQAVWVQRMYAALRAGQEVDPLA